MKPARAADLAAWQAQHLQRTRYALQPLDSVTLAWQGQRLVNFASNDYLGFTHHPAMKQAMQACLHDYGSGAGASQMVAGFTPLQAELEAAIATFTGRQRALFFANGFMANLGIISALVGKGDWLLQDRLNHASLLDAGRLAGAQQRRYQHLSPLHLQQRLQTIAGSARKLIVSEGVFSMDGDIAPLTQLADIAKQHQALFLVDDAHGFGVLGEHGGGSLQHSQLNQQQVPLLMATFGKALGCYGAFIAGDADLLEMILQFARSFIYTTALPPVILAANKTALSLLSTTDARARLHRNINFFVAQAQQRQLPLMTSSTPIQPLIIGSAAAAEQCQQYLMQQGYYTGLMRPPSVPADSSRLRITLSADHQPQQIVDLLDCLQRVLPRYMQAGV